MIFDAGIDKLLQIYNNYCSVHKILSNKEQ